MCVRGIDNVSFHDLLNLILEMSRRCFCFVFHFKYAIMQFSFRDTMGDYLKYFLKFTESITTTALSFPSST
jgi:hypothetical protein